MSDSSRESIPADAIDLGRGHWAQKRYLDGVLRGIEELHYNALDNLCGGWTPINVDGETRHWTLVSEDPLTLSPSLQCGACPAHGFVRDGRWQDA